MISLKNWKFSKLKMKLETMHASILNIISWAPMTYLKMNYLLLYLSINTISWNLGYIHDPSISLETSLTLKDIFLLCIHLSSSKHYFITNLPSRRLSRTEHPHVQHVPQQWPPNFGGPQLFSLITKVIDVTPIFSKAGVKSWFVFKNLWFYIIFLK